MYKLTKVHEDVGLTLYPYSPIEGVFQLMSPEGNTLLISDNDIEIGFAAHAFCMGYFAGKSAERNRVKEVV
jgi:hypothetical protein